MNAKELKEAKVAFISLVSRPASRIPFRITKSDNDNDNSQDGSLPMFNLSSVFKRDGEPTSTVPTVAALAIRKEDADKLLPLLVEKGFITDNQIERDDALILKQVDDFNESEVMAFKMSDDVVAMISNVQKSFQPFTDSISFAENIAGMGFMPGVFTATDALMDTFHNILRKADNSTTVRADMSTAITEFGDFVSALASDLPEVVFKLEGNLLNKTETATKAEDDPAEETAETNTATAEETDDSAQTEETTTEETATKEEVTDTTDTDTTTKSEDDVAADEAARITEAVKGDIDDDILNPNVAKGESAESGETVSESTDTDTVEAVSKGDTAEALMVLLKSMQTQLKDGLSTVTKSLEKVEQTNSDLASRMTTVEQVAKTANEAVNGTVVVGSDIVHSESLGNQSRTMKKDEADDSLWDGSGLDKIIG